MGRRDEWEKATGDALAADDRKLAIEVAMRRVQLARENWHAVTFGSYRDVTAAVRQQAEVVTREAVVQADLALMELLRPDMR